MASFTSKPAASRVLVAPVVAVALATVAAAAPAPQQVLWQQYGEVRKEKLGQSVVWLDDLDGDGVCDFAAGAPAWDPPEVLRHGIVRICSGVDGSLLRELSDKRHSFGLKVANAGDLDGFMSDYARDSTTSYVSRGAVRYGIDRIRANYASRFAPGAARDSLRFETLVARPLGDDHALVTARYILHRDGKTTASGPFSVIMERRTDGWKILHDHTSSD